MADERHVIGTLVCGGLRYRPDGLRPRLYPYLISQSMMGLMLVYASLIPHSLAPGSPSDLVPDLCGSLGRPRVALRPPQSAGGLVGDH